MIIIIDGRLSWYYLMNFKKAAHRKRQILQPIPHVVDQP